MDYPPPSQYPNYPPAQPPPPPQQQQQQVVIVNQPMAGGMYPQMQMAEWSTGLCGCFEDCCSCIYSFMCYQCFLCSLAGEMQECTCGPFCFGTPFLTAMRTKTRMQFGIRGSICNDLCCMLWCQCCAALQIHRERKLHNQAAF